jgi:hypothetical protein
MRIVEGKTVQGTRRYLRRPYVKIAVSVALLSLVSFEVPFSSAQTRMDLMRWREYSYARDTNELGTRTVALNGVHRTGFVVLGEGKFARVSSSLVHTTTPERRQHCQGFVVYDFDDGSSIVAKVDIAGEPDTRQLGTIVFLSGTGRFTGITGRGTIYAWMPAQWELYCEVEASYFTDETKEDDTP